MIVKSKSLRAAFVAALAIGTAGGALLATPAMAKEKAPKQQPPKVSPGFQKVAAPLQTKINAAKTRPDVVAAKGNKAALAAALAPEKAELDQAFAAVVNEDDRLIAGQFAFNLGMIADDTALQRKGLETMLASGKLPAADVPRFNFYAGQFAYQAKDYANARKYMQAALDGGYTENDPAAFLARIQSDSGDVAGGMQTMLQSVQRAEASGKPASEGIYRSGLLAAYKAKQAPAASTFASGLVKNYPTQQNWGIAITIIREISGIPSQDMLDLLRLMGRTNSYAEGRDYLEYAEAADPRRLPGEASKVIEAGIAAGKLTSSDRTVSDYRTIANERLAADKASLPSLERDARAGSATAVTALASGDAFLSYGEAAKAEALYAIALGKPGVDQARALTRLGIAQADQGKYAEAQATFAKITTGPRKPIADLWSAYAASKARPAA